MNKGVDSAAVAWHISTYSDGAGANCVEAGPILDASDRIAVRDSTRPAAGMFVAAAPTWRAFADWAARQSV